MEIGRIIRLALAPLLLTAMAFAAWQTAESFDFEDVAGARQPYDSRLDTAVLSARRVPRTLQAPVSDDILSTTLTATADAHPNRSCLAVASGDRQIEPSAAVSGGVVPASNQKLFTTFAALDVLGDQFAFTTSVQTAAALNNGVVEGDLYLVGDGDPFLNTDNWAAQYDVVDGRSRTRLEDLADSVLAAGVTTVAGSVLGDESLYDTERYGPWDARLIPQNQSGPLSALTVNEGFADWPATFTGSFRPRKPTDDPPLHAAALFADLLQQRGVTIEGAPGAGPTPAGARTIAEISSPPLTETITHINSYSSNIGAELLLKRIGLAQNGAGTTSAGAQAVSSVLEGRGIPLDGVVINDGSGLAESNRMTCNAVTGLLSLAPADSSFAQSLSIVGLRGTLAERFLDSAAVGRVSAKTGTLQGVRALSGYATSNVDDSDLVFSYIINDSEIVFDEHVAPQQSLLEALIRYPEGPSVGELSPRPAVGG